MGSLGRDVVDAHSTWVQQLPHVEAALQEAQAVVQRHGLRRRRIACGVASLMGWLTDWDGAWPGSRVELERVDSCWDQGRGCKGLRANRRIAASSAIGVCAELDRRAGRDRTLAWWPLAWSYMAEYCAGVANACLCTCRT